MLTGPERVTWLAERRRGIGGSDAAAILGFSPWKTAMDVWLDKLGMIPERTDPDKEFLFELGNRLEPVIAALYARETNQEIVIPSPSIFYHPKYPELLGSPDRVAADAFGAGPKFGVELKSENEFTDLFGNPGTDQVPHHYLIQCAHYMSVMDFPRWDIAVLHGGARFNVYRLERDLELENAMVEQLVAWWEKHVLGNTPPAVDASEGWRRYLHAKHPVELTPIEVLAPEKAQLVANLAQIRTAEKRIDAMRGAVESELKQIIGDAEGVTSQYGRITWKKTADARFVDWKNAFRALCQKYGTQPEMQLEIIKPFEETRPGVRRFLFTPKKEKHGQRKLGTQQTGIDAANLLPSGNGEHGTSGAS